MRLCLKLKWTLENPFSLLGIRFFLSRHPLSTVRIFEKRDLGTLSLVIKGGCDSYVLRIASTHKAELCGPYVSLVERNFITMHDDE
jgi:hypothetical protein